MTTGESSILSRLRDEDQGGGRIDYDGKWLLPNGKQNPRASVGWHLCEPRRRVLPR